jgi:DNA-binding NtrC family response regulator
MNKKILIIDDETDFCLIMKNYFNRKGYNVSVAYSLSEGLKKLSEFHPNILFLDNNLPDGNGWDALNSIVEKFPQLNTYLVSAHRNNSPLDKQNNNIVVWEKPISMEMLNRIF